jgi:tetratricopeptide (TPR) repeat protein
MIKRWAGVWAVFALAVMVPVPGQASNRETMGRYISFYENGEYAKAVDSLKAVLPLLSNKEELAECYKYLAFSYVMLDMINAAKANFGEMIQKFPTMEVDTVSVPPNITVVFRQVKIENELERQKRLEKEREKGSRRNDRLFYGLTGVAGAGSLAVGVVFYLSGADAYQKYNNAEAPDEISRYRNQVSTDYVISDVGLGITVIAAGLITYRLITGRKNQPGPSAGAIGIKDNTIVFNYSF